MIRGQLWNDIDDHDETMVDKWNSIVKDGSLPYHLGDVYMGNDYTANKLLSRLKGRKRLIAGNHDQLKNRVLQNHFQKITVWRKFKEFQCLLTHIPIKIEHPGWVNVHGHIHQNDSTLPWVNASVEKTNYAPICLQDLYEANWNVEEVINVRNS